MPSEYTREQVLTHKGKLLYGENAGPDDPPFEDLPAEARLGWIDTAARGTFVSYIRGLGARIEDLKKAVNFQSDTIWRVGRKVACEDSTEPDAVSETYDYEGGGNG